MKKIVLTLSTIVALAACSEETKQDLGLVNTPPDEFVVVTRAPLSVPPDYALRPPRPGAGRPMEMSTQEQARQTVFGEGDMKGTYTNPAASSSESPFLNRVGVQDADPNIRNTVDSEETKDTRTTAERLLFMSGDKDNGEPINPTEEYERLKAEGVVTTKKRDDAVEGQ